MPGMNNSPDKALGQHSLVLYFDHSHGLIYVHTDLFRTYIGLHIARQKPKLIYVRGYGELETTFGRNIFSLGA